MEFNAIFSLSELLEELIKIVPQKEVLDGFYVPSIVPPNDGFPERIVLNDNIQIETKENGLFELIDDYADEILTLSAFDLLEYIKGMKSAENINFWFKYLDHLPLYYRKGYKKTIIEEAKQINDKDLIVNFNHN